MKFFKKIKEWLLSGVQGKAEANAEYWRTKFGNDLIYQCANTSS